MTSESSGVADEKIARALVARTDRLEVQVDRLTGDVQNLTKALTALLQRKQAEGNGQPNWLAVHDPAIAEAILLNADTWLSVYGVNVGLDVTRCWPWHPAAVGLVVAVAQHHSAVYAGDAPAAVTDFLARVVPTVAGRLRTLLNTCNDHQHFEGATRQTAYAVSLDLLPELARWWVTNRQGLPPGLTARTAAA